MPLETIDLIKEAVERPDSMKTLEESLPVGAPEGWILARESSEGKPLLQNIL
jgi:hypothetical protein